MVLAGLILLVIDLSTVQKIADCAIGVSTVQKNANYFEPKNTSGSSSIINRGRHNRITCIPQ